MTGEGRAAKQIEKDLYNVKSSWLNQFESIGTSRGNMQQDHIAPEAGSGVAERKRGKTVPSTRLISA